MPEATTTTTNKPSSQEQRHRYEELQRHVATYQGQFPDVPTMTSAHLVETMQMAGETAVTIVDVRTPEEHAVSRIPGAIPLHEFMQQVPSDTNHDHADDGENDDCNTSNTILVLYCTVGYRSGREARQLQESPHAHKWKGKIYNLDGILAYTHVEGAPPLVTTTTITTKKNGNNDGNSSAAETSQQVPTKRIHTYGPSWDCAHPDYEAVWFRKTSFVRHVCQTVCWSAVRLCQHFVASQCRCRHHQRQQQDKREH